MKQTIKLYKENIKYIEIYFNYDINNRIIESTNYLVNRIKDIIKG